MVTFETVDQALKRCIERHPPCPPEYRMHSDANAIADVWAAMVCGSAETIPANVAAKLATEYPRDRATGYAPGQIRGAVTVKKPLAE